LREYPGRIRLVEKDLPLARHVLARGAHEAARCAGAAGQYWAYHDRLYAAQAAFERVKLIRYAGDLGIDTVAFTRCLDRREFARAVDADVAEARELGFWATPSFLINGRPVVGALPIESFREVVEAALAEARPRM
jgi:protein-disulfide isomerase